MRSRDEYHDDEDDGRQIKRYPDHWIRPREGLAVGTKVRVTDKAAKSGGFFAMMAGQVGVVVLVTRGDGHPFPSIRDRNGLWLTEATGWLSVRFEKSPYGKDEKGEPGLVAFDLSEEGEVWEVVEEKGCALREEKGRRVSSSARPVAGMP